MKEILTSNLCKAIDIVDKHAYEYNLFLHDALCTGPKESVHNLAQIFAARQADLYIKRYKNLLDDPSVKAVVMDYLNNEKKGVFVTDYIFTTQLKIKLIEMESKKDVEEQEPSV